MVLLAALMAAVHNDVRAAAAPTRNAPVEFASALHFDDSLRSTPYDFRPPTLLAFHSSSDSQCADLLQTMHFVSEAPSLLPRTRLLVGIFDSDGDQAKTSAQLESFEHSEAMVDLEARFGVIRCPTLVLVPPEYMYPQNKTMAPMIWDGQGDWAKWARQNARKMKKPHKSKAWTLDRLLKRDESETALHNQGARSKQKQRKAVLTITNDADYGVDVHWIPAQGDPRLQATLPAGETERLETFVGHRFVVARAGTRQAVRQLGVGVDAGAGGGGPREEL
eukprot:g333.t1